MDAVAAKICSVCGIDCSAKKRAKDANGRYICADCLERAREAKVAKEGKPVVVATGPVVPKKVSAAPAMLPNGVDPIMDNLVAGSKALHQVACTQCAYPMDREAKICTHCGFNTLSGKVMKTAIYKAPKEVKEKSRQGRSFHISPNGLFFAILVLVLGPAGLGAAIDEPMLILVGWGILALTGLVVTVALIADGFRNSPVSGGLMLAGLFVPILGIYTIYYALTQAEEGVRKAYIATILCWIAMFTAMLMSAIPRPFADVG